jgi:hypothetical protein
MPWDFSEVPKLVGRLLAGAFGGHLFKVRRNKGEQRISISWEVGPTYGAVHDFVWKTFPRIGFDSDWGNREYDPPEMIEGRLLHPYFYDTRRLDLFGCGAMDIPRLIAAGADIRERDGRNYLPIEHAVMRGDESAAIALLEVGSDYYSLLPGGDLYEAKLIMPVLWAAVESRMLSAEVDGNEERAVQRQRL